MGEIFPRSKGWTPAFCPLMTNGQWQNFSGCLGAEVCLLRSYSFSPPQTLNTRIDGVCPLFGGLQFRTKIHQKKARYFSATGCLLLVRAQTDCAQTLNSCIATFRTAAGLDLDNYGVPIPFKSGATAEGVCRLVSNLEIMDGSKTTRRL